MKSEHIKTHRLAVLAHLMSETLDDIQQQCGELKENCAKIVPQVEEILTDVYQVEQIHSGTYLTDIANKVDTVIRKNYINITH